MLRDFTGATERVSFSGERNIVTEFPRTVALSGVRQVQFELLSDPDVTPGTLGLDLQPPEAFRADRWDRSGNLLVSSAPGVSGGTVVVRMSPEAQLAKLTANGPDLRLAARGTRLFPLRLGALTLNTSGRGVVTVEYLHVENVMRLDNYDNGSNVQVGAGVSAGFMFVPDNAVHRW